MKIIPEITAEQENRRTVELITGEARFLTSRCDPVEPVPVGSFVAMVFRVTGYDQDCDGSLMARVAEVDEQGEETGWKQKALGIDGCVQLEDPGELHRLCGRGEEGASA